MILMNMFKSFDPSSNPMAFTLGYLVLLTIQMTWVTKMMKIQNKTFKMMVNEIKPNTSSKNQNSSVKMFISLFFMFFMMNISGLMPSSFSLTSQMSINFPIAVLIWLSYNLFSVMKKKEKFISHLLPIGTPMSLSPFLVLIELISNLIRPITLSVRLSANMIAGHILITLMENFVIFMNPNMMISALTSSVLIILETGVSVIQSYVFALLVSLYYSETH